MSITTKSPKAERLAAIRKFQGERLKTIGVTSPLVSAKAIVRPFEDRKPYLSLFESEVRREPEMYVELTDYDNNPIDSTRKLYKLPFNPFYKEEYETIPYTDDEVRYLVSIDYLQEVIFPTDKPTENTVQTIQSTTLDELLNDELPNPDDDLPISQLTIRDLVAILHRVPVSKKKWLNEILKK